MVQRKGFARLLEIADEKRGLLIVSCVLSAMSALSMLIPYVSVYYILQELLLHAADISSADWVVMIQWGGYCANRDARKPYHDVCWRHGFAYCGISHLIWTSREVILAYWQASTRLVEQFVDGGSQEDTRTERRED